MLFQNNSVKELRISKDLYSRLSQFLSKDFSHRYVEGDSDKSLEIDLCKAIVGDHKQVSEPKDLIEEFNEIDCWIDGESVQIKCRNKKDFLILEDYKLKTNGEKTSWVDRSVAQYTIFIYLGAAPHIYYYIYETQDLKRALRNLRNWRDNKALDTEMDLLWMNKFFPGWDWEYNYKICNKNTDIESGIFKLLLN